MARGKSGTSADTNVIASEPLTSLLDPLESAMPVEVSPFDLSLLEDGRQYHPEGVFRPPLSFDGYTDLEVPRAVPGAAARPTALPVAVGFANPERVGICVRRRTRREVLFAKNFHRRGAGSARRHTRWSKVKC